MVPTSKRENFKGVVAYLDGEDPGVAKEETRFVIGDGDL